MPIYEYQCSKCQHIFEEWVKTSEAHNVCACPECGAPAEHILSNTAFVLKGGGWYVTDYGYRKGVSESGENAGKDAGSSAASSDKASGGEKAAAPAAGAKSDIPAAPAPASKPASTAAAAGTA